MKLKNQTLLLNVFLSTIFCFFIVNNYVKQEHDIYFWDYMRSWRMYQELGQLWSQNILDFFIVLFQSIFSQEYNFLSSAILQPFHLLPNGNGRLIFISAISIIYLIPVALLISTLINQHSVSSRQSFWIYFWVAMFFVPFWKPIMRGYTDIAGMIPILYVIYYVLKHDLAEKVKLKHVITIGVMLWSAFVLRRWYAYTVVALYITLPFISIWISQNSLKLKNKINHTFTIYGTAGLISLGCVFIFQQHLFQEIISYDYGYAYSAYKFSTSLNIQQFIEYFGFGWILLSAVSWLLAMYFVMESRPLLITIFSTAIISYALFYRTVSPDMHHFIPLGTWFLLSLGIFLQWGLNKWVNTYQKIGVVITLLMIHISILLYSLFPITSFQFIALPSTTYPLHLKYYDNYKNMIDFVQNRLTDDEKKFVVVSADFKLNGSLINRLMSPKYFKNKISNPDIDLRDGMPVHTLFANYVIITNPAGMYLPSGQENVRIISNALINQKGIGRHYQEIAKYKIDDATDAIVYQKISDFSRDDVVDYINQFVAIYPETKEIYLTPQQIDFILSKRIDNAEPVKQ